VGQVRPGRQLLLLVEWDDDRFCRDGQLTLFDLLGSADRRLIAYAGADNETHPCVIPIWRTFVSSHLADADSHSAAHWTYRAGLAS
jgi:hypothetical protein